MKIERKLFDFFAEKWKRNENMETEIELYEIERNVFGGSENGIGTAFLQNRRRNRISVF
jgi:hypothetical protein